MKHKLLYTFLFLFISGSCFAQFYRQYFDGADTAASNSIRVLLDQDTSNIWQIGNPNKMVFDQAATNPNAIVTDTVNYYPVNNISRFIIKVPLDYNWGVFALQWKQKLDLDVAEGGIIEYTTDSGNTWVNVFNNPYVYNFYGFNTSNAGYLFTGEEGFVGVDTTWRDVWLCFDFSWTSQFMVNDTIMIRYSFKSDSIVNSKDGWMIDNMIAHSTIIHTINEKKTDKYLSVYPTPASDNIYIEAQKIQDFHIIEHMVLLNSSGQVVEEWRNIPTKFFINAKKYSSGMYHLKIRTNIRSEVLPVLIHHK